MYHVFNNFKTGKVAQGRAEYIRVLLEDAGVAYQDSCPK
jgi:hypothetical protein